MDAFVSNLANKQTDRQTNEHEQKHVPSPLSEVKNTGKNMYLLLCTPVATDA